MPAWVLTLSGGPTAVLKCYGIVLGVCALVASAVALLRLFPLVETLEPGEPSSKEFWGIYGSAWGAAGGILLLFVSG